ncbi:biotin-dependent carboxyltransferase family protein [Parasphingorhabdus sp.]|uniref:5-oxoprolinase subunit C family protein n=1 Tax=Parasphingorhabdus sp. TaxID=2709688 RepID=UPI003593BE47
MSIRVLKAGLQTTLQGDPFRGHRHLGMPSAGAADALSLALANFLVGKSSGALAFEITLTDAIFEITEPCLIAVVGSAEFVRINGKGSPQHQTKAVVPGDSLHIGPSLAGCRTYLATSAEICAEKLLGGKSTYLVAGLGGFHGRALKDRDIIPFLRDFSADNIDLATPPALRPHYSHDHVLRVTPGPEGNGPTEELMRHFCHDSYTVGARASRMGMMLEGAPLGAGIFSNMPSAAVFPGTIQLPPSGKPYLLGPDAQTTGGYPRIAQVIRADRHLIGQLRPGSRVQFVQTTTARATEIYREKLSLLSSWLGQIDLW